MTISERTKLLKMDDNDLLKLCHVTVARGSGRGGQKRNRTESAVRITHEPTGTSAQCDRSRSQQTNRKIALRKLRLNIALSCRCPADADAAITTRPGPKSGDYPLWVAAVLDILAAAEYRVSEAAEQLGLSTGRLVRDLAADPAVWQTVNAEREHRGYSKLRT